MGYVVSFMTPASDPMLSASSPTVHEKGQQESPTSLKPVSSVCLPSMMGCKLLSLTSTRVGLVRNGTSSLLLLSVQWGGGGGGGSWGVGGILCLFLKASCTRDRVLTRGLLTQASDVVFTGV